GPDWATSKVQLIDGNGADRLALDHAVFRHTELPIVQRNTIGELGAGRELGRGDDCRNDVVPTIQLLARDHDHRMGMCLVEVGHVNFAGLDHDQYGFSWAQRRRVWVAFSSHALCSALSSRSSRSSFTRS